MSDWRVDTYRVIILQGISLEKKLNWVQTIDLNLLTYGSDDLT
jgi:hypothetical protein